MEIKINLNINLENLNEFLDKLSKLNQTKIEQIMLPSREIPQSIDISKLREKVAKVTQTGNIIALQNLLKKYNAKTLVEVNKEDYNSLYNEISKLIN